MAFSNGFGERNDDFPFRNPQSPPNENSPFGDLSGQVRNTASRKPSSSQPLDPRASLQRRFTTESGRTPPMPPIGQMMEPQDPNASDPRQLGQLLEKKQFEREMLREHRRRWAAEMQKLDSHLQSNDQELLKMKQDLDRAKAGSGHQSEPTTPPEFQDPGFPSSLSRPTRYSASSMTSPPGLSYRFGTAGSQLTSPASKRISAPVISSKMPSKSVPGSRRNSDENEPESTFDQEPVGHRSAAALNRNSMPATGVNLRARPDLPDYASVLGLGQINTTGFLFGDDDAERGSAKKDNPTTSPDVKSYLQMNATDDKFPILVRRNDHPGLLSASSAALDLALSQSPGPEFQAGGWSSLNRHRAAQHSLSMNTKPIQSEGGQGSDATKITSSGGASVDESPSSSRGYDRRSLDLTHGSYGDNKKASTSSTTPLSTVAQSNPPKLQSSYSTNDIPTMKNAGAMNGVPTANTHAQKHFHNHNASLGRIPPNAVNNRLSRDLSGNEATPGVRDGQNGTYQPLQSILQGGAAPFGPPIPATVSAGHATAAVSPPAMNPYGPPGYFGGYGMPMMNMAMNNLQLSNQVYQSQPGYGHYSMYPYAGRGTDSQARVIQQRRMADGEGMFLLVMCLSRKTKYMLANRFANVQIETLQGEIYALCKDQHGCRFLQKKLEDRNPEHIHMIFTETNQHVVELMTDPFGNYLCQKLLEYANDDQRTVLINNAAPQLVKIALNQHGTRALQKMIEFISTPEQIQTIIYALQDKVVELIQDLNGNHVIQKCLNRLSPEDAQRCIDHASGSQKAQLISQISMNALALVQDPFGNYVVQYILDLGEATYTEPLIHRFVNQIAALSKQKFSSNVIEKCLRTAEPNMKQLMIEEMLEPSELEKMLRDSYANYVIQTAIEFSDPESQLRLVECIRPMLPSIRSTPFGRRIQGKIQAIDSRSGSSSGQMTPNDCSSPGQIPLGRQPQTSFHHRPMSSQGQAGFGPNGSFGNVGFGHGTGSPGPSGMTSSAVGGSSVHGHHRFSNPPVPDSSQMTGQKTIPQGFSHAYGRGVPPSGGYYF
ncbi:MAG: hypothetical protein M1833_003295 [Piccolia ochrophora]|nr:MAG: hypothetical protein M1833_003295 [Piccolia ochrophora]